MSKPQIKIGGVEYPMTEVNKTLNALGRQWRKNARISLKMQGRINTGKLYDSMPVTVGEDKDGYFVNITPQVDYWAYVDKGVQGASKNIYPKQSESPFKFGSGRGGSGLRAAIDRWTVQKNIEGTRDEKGRFTPRKSVVFLISRAIWNRGLKPSLFITGTRERLQKKAVAKISKALGKDIANALRLNLKLDKNLDVK